jgi:AcrR family transcriptional regulator
MSDNNYHHGDLKNQLVKIGEKLLFKEGHEGFSLRKVARAAKVSHTAPYRHFKEKDELIIEIMNRWLIKFHNFCYGSIIRYPDDLLSQLKNMGKRYILFLVKYPGFMHLMFSTNIRTKFKDRITPTHTFDLFTNCLKKCYKKKLIIVKDFESFSIMLWSFVHGLACLLTEKTIEPGNNIQAFVSKMIDVYISAII